MNVNKDELDIIEVDENDVVVSEEIIEEEELEEINVGNGRVREFISSDEFNEKMKELKEEIRNAKYKYSKVSESIAKELIKKPKEDLDNNSYIWIMFALHLSYGKVDNRYGTNYTALRGIDVIRQSSSNKKSTVLDFEELDVDQEIINHFTQFTKLIYESLQQLGGKLFKFGIILTVISFAFKFLNIIDLTTVLIVDAIMWVLIFTYFKPNLERKYLTIQCNSLLKHLDIDLINFDTIVLISKVAK